MPPPLPMQNIVLYNVEGSSNVTKNLVSSNRYEKHCSPKNFKLLREAQSFLKVCSRSGQIRWTFACAARFFNQVNVH